MKKTLALLLAAALCLSLAGMSLAAGEAGSEEIAVTADNWQEYFQLKPEYEGRFDVVELQALLAARPVPQREDAVEAPITLENWSQYFELVPEEHEEKDAFGELDTVWGDYHVYLREEFKDALVPTGDSHVAFAFSFDCNRVSVTVTEADGGMTTYSGGLANAWEQISRGATYTLAENSDPAAGDALFAADQPESAYISGAELIRERFPAEESDEDGMLTVQECTNFQATRVEGSLFLTGAAPAADAQEGPTAVAVTADNWSEYFELVGETVLNRETNVFGEEELKNAEYRYYLRLKDEYRARLAADGENAVAYEMEYASGWYYAAFDDQTQELAIGALVPSGTVIRSYGSDTTISQPDGRGTKMGTAEVVDMEGAATVADDVSQHFEEEGMAICQGEFGTDGYCVRVLRDIAMLRIEGTITLDS